MTIDDFIQERKRLKEEILKLGRLYHLVNNHHIYPLMIDDGKFSSFGYTPSRHIIDELMQDIKNKISKVQEELTALESRFKCD